MWDQRKRTFIGHPKRKRLKQLSYSYLMGVFTSFSFSLPRHTFYKYVWTLTNIYLLHCILNSYLHMYLFYFQLTKDFFGRITHKSNSKNSVEDGKCFKSFMYVPFYP